MKKRNNTGWFHERAIAELLCALHKKEIRLLTNYLKTYASPGVLQLWQVLKTKYPDFKIQDKTLRQSARKGAPISQNVYTVLLTNLGKHTTAFFTQQEFEKNRLLYANIRAEALMKRRAKRTYEKIKNQSEQLFTIKQKLNPGYYEFLHQNRLTDFQYNTLYKPLQSENSLQEASDFHDYSFLAIKLRYLVVMHNRQQIVKTTYNKKNETEFIEYLLKFPIDELPLIKAYYLTLRLLQNGSFDNFIAFKEHLLPCRGEFDQAEVRLLLSLGGNVCFWNIQNGHLEFLEERFALTKIMVEEGYLNVLGYFSNNHFRTTLRDAIEAEQLSWAYEFLMAKLPITHPDHRTNLELLGWASWYFAKGVYDKQHTYMVQMQSVDYKFTDFQNELAYRVLRLKTDYTLLGNQPRSRTKEAFLGHLKSYLRYCERKTDIPEKIRQSRLNFGVAVRLIFHFRYGKKQSSDDLKTAIINKKPMIELPWLLGELNRYQK